MSLLQYAFKLLARRAHGKIELKRKLLRKGSEQEVDQALEKLEAIGYLDDEDFSLQRALSRRQHRLWGNFRIAQDLNRLGVNAKIVGLTLLKLEDKSPEVEALRQAVDRWIRRSGEPTEISELKRLFDYCSRLGYPTDEIRQVLAPRFRKIDWKI